MKISLICIVLSLLPHLVCCVVKYYTHDDVKYIVDDSVEVNAPGAQGVFRRGIRRVKGGSDEIVWFKYIRKISQNIESDFYKNERKFYDIIKKNPNPNVHFPTVYATGVDENIQYSYLIMQHLGENLASIFKKCDKKFSYTTIVKLLKKMMDYLEYCFNNGFIYNDLRSENFLFGMTGPVDIDKLYLVDFGISDKLYSNELTLPNTLKSGTLDFMTNYAFDHAVRSLVQDLGSLAYFAIYFLNEGILPWSEKPRENNDARNFVKAEKDKLTAKAVGILLKVHPEPFAEFVNYALMKAKVFSNDLSVLNEARKILDEIHLNPSAEPEWKSAIREPPKLPESLNEYWEKHGKLPAPYNPKQWLRG